MEIILSKRLETIASFIPKGVKFADIGSDHALIPCAICIKDPTSSAIAGEVKEGPLTSAQQTVDAHQLNHQIDVRLGDGLDVIDHDVTHLIIAGMGGGLIASILERGKEQIASVKQIIVQPNVGSNHVRKWFDTNNFILTDEVMVEEKGHIYEVLVATKDRSNKHTMDAKEIFFGPVFLQNKSHVFIKKWQRELGHLQQIIQQMKQSKNPDPTQLNQFRQHVLWIEEELNHES